MTPARTVVRFLQTPSPYVLLTLVPLVWAGNWVIGRAMRNDMPPVAMGFWRWALALLILLPFAAPELVREWRVVRAHWRILVALGCLGAVFFNTMLYVGLQYTAATNGVLFNSISPILIALASSLLLREHLRAVQWLGVCASFAGVAAIVSRGDLSTLAALEFNRGDLWLMAAMVLWSLYTLVLQRRPAGLSAVAFLAAMLLLSLPVLAPFYVWEYVERGGFRLTFATVSALAYYATLPSIVAYLAWNRAVAEVGPNRAGLFVHLMPVYGALLSVTFLDETLHAYHALGAATIFGGIWLTTRPPSRSAVAIGATGDATGDATGKEGR
jgi:drug/metabolite transporter (DMT)-like permease